MIDGADKMNTVTAPMQELVENSRQWNYPLTDVRFARSMDDNDPLRGFRQQFNYPKLRGLPSSVGKFGTYDVAPRRPILITR